MKKFLFFLLNILSFGLIGKTRLSYNQDDEMLQVMDELERSFDKMNFDGSFDKGSDQNSFNLRVAKVLRMPTIQQAVAGRVSVPLATGSSGATAQAMIAYSKGDLNLTVTRDSVNIAENLPYVIFGANDFRASYVSTLRRFLPPGVTVAVSSVAGTGDVLFTYTQGANVDTITVSFGGLNNYTSFLQSMNTTYFKCRYILYSISDIANLSQFFQIISFGELTSLASEKQNQLSPNSRKLPSDFQDDRVNLIFPEQSVNPDFSFVQNFGQFVMTVNWDIYMSEQVKSFPR